MTLPKRALIKIKSIVICIFYLTTMYCVVVGIQPYKTKGGEEFSEPIRAGVYTSSSQLKVSILRHLAPFRCQQFQFP